MAPDPLTADRVLEATEEVLRRFGPAKATVVDVARALGVSHGSVYRHFPSKSALREAVCERWLDRWHAALPPIAADRGRPAAERLRDWLETLFTAKRAKAGDDPELFATYQVLAGEASEAVARHVEAMVAQLARIIAQGVERGEFRTGDPARSARAVWDATCRFHDPRYAAHWREERIAVDFEAVCALVLAGLAARRQGLPKILPD